MITHLKEAAHWVIAAPNVDSANEAGRGLPIILKESQIAHRKKVLTPYFALDMR